jgi:hypothetical protein
MGITHKVNRRMGKASVMAPTKILAVLCVVVFLLISAVALLTAPASPAAAEAVANPEVGNLIVLHLGGGDLASQVVDRLEEMGAEAIDSTDIPEAVEPGPDVIVIFGGQWFEQRMYETTLHDFLRAASSAGAGVVMAGGSTSKFLEALDRAGTLEIPVTETGQIRNPAYFDPPMVGVGSKTGGGHVGPSLFFSDTSNPDVLAESLVRWLRSTPAVPAMPADAGAPYSGFVTEYNYLPLLDSELYGRLNVTVPIYKLMNDHVADYDWYLYRVEVQSVAGKIAYSSPWVTDYTWAHHLVAEGGADRWLDDYDPTTTYGMAAVDVSFWPNFDPWSYSIKDVMVLDYSDYPEQTAYWQHDIDQRKAVAQTSYLSEPGFEVMTTQDNPPLVDAWYQVRFAKPFLWFWWSTKTVGPSPILFLDAVQAGD